MAKKQNAKAKPDAAKKEEKKEIVSYEAKALEEKPKPTKERWGGCTCLFIKKQHYNNSHRHEWC